MKLKMREGSVWIGFGETQRKGTNIVLSTKQTNENVYQERLGQLKHWRRHG